MADGDPLFRKTIVLSNGAKAPLAETVLHLASLQALADTQGRDRQVLYALRESCLGRPIAPSERKLLEEEKLVDAAGAVNPSLKDVVLASVRGEGKALFLASPYTDAWDRIMGNFLLGRAAIRDQFSERDADLFINEPGFGGEHDTPESIRKWADLVRKGRGKGPTGGIEPGSN